MILRVNLLSLAAIAGTTSAFTAPYTSSRSSLFHTARHASTNSGPSPEFLRKMGLSEEEDLDRLRQEGPRGSSPGMAPPQWMPPPGIAPPQPPMQSPPQPSQQQQQQQQQFYDQFGNPVTMPMVYDQNGNLVPFNPAGMGMAPPQAQIPSPPNMQQPIEPPLPQVTKTRPTDSPRPVGYNPDAYSISNTADVYFAQLKLDSKIRKEAWLKGDKEFANKPFADDSVKAIRDMWVDNPYTKEKNIEEAKREIAGAVRLQMTDNSPQQMKTQLSYRQKLEQMKAKKGGNPGATYVGQQQPPAMQSTQNRVPPNVAEKSRPAAGVSSAVTTTSTVSTLTQPQSQSTPTGTAVDEDEKRKIIRTTQGLLLKHRGGPGFGSGRLKGPEAQRLENTLQEIQDILYSEVGVKQSTPSSNGIPKMVSEPDQVAKVPPVTPAAPVAPKTSATPAAPMMQSKPISSASPVKPVAVAPPKPSVPASIPAPISPATPIECDPMDGSIACIEAVLKMYKEAATPAEREAMLIPLREALMAAAGTSNKVIAEQQLAAHKAALAGGASSSGAAAVTAKPVSEMSEPVMGFPTSYAVAKPEEMVAPVAASAPSVPATPVASVAKAQPLNMPMPSVHSPPTNVDISGLTSDDLRIAASEMDATTVTALITSGLEMDEETTDLAFWAVVQAVDDAEAQDKPLPASVPQMLHHIFDADLKHLLTREKISKNVTCMQPDDTDEKGAALRMNYIFDDSSHKDLPLKEGRRCEGGSCCEACSRNIFPTFASRAETSLTTFPEIASFTFNELATVSAASILHFTRLIERVRRTIAHEYGLPLKTILPLQAYSRKYVAGTTQKGGGGGEGDFVTLHTDEATHTGYHYSCVIYLNSQGEEFTGGDFVFNDPAPKKDESETSKTDEEEEEEEEYYEPYRYASIEDEIRRAGRELTPFHPSRGAAVIFSSGWENMHEVERVTSGVRYAVPCFFTTCPVPEAAYDQMVAGKPKTDEDIADDWLHLLLAHREESPLESTGRVKELLMKWHYMCTPLSEH
mmetsp:Transcript_4531/g.9647  ORF Transcript_4531/g.9647 Transcript_4531/m.9647 type:complete len:1029 (-) Transcript_4531:237-3323(-)